MVWGFKYIQIEEDGKVKAACADSVEGVTIDVEDLIVPEMPTDAYYSLYYSAENGLYYVKIADFESEESTDEVSWDVMAEAINEGVNEV
jgi:hypothetical protein